MSLNLSDDEISDASDRMKKYLLQHIEKDFEVDDLMDLFEVLGISRNKDYIAVCVSDLLKQRKLVYLNRTDIAGRLAEDGGDGGLKFVVEKAGEDIEYGGFSIDDIERIEWTNNLYIVLNEHVRTRIDIVEMYSE